MGLALLLTAGLKRLSYFHRVVMYLPAVLPMLVISLVFKSILNPATGLLNTFLRDIGLGFLAQRWLVDIHWALPSVIAVDTWRGVGYIMVILIAGLQAIPKEYYEAAAIDGASGIAAFWRITLPLMLPVLTVTTVLNLLYGLKVFDIVFVLTNGGPGRATDTVYTTIFDEFSKGRYGVATTLVFASVLDHDHSRLFRDPADASRRGGLIPMGLRRIRGLFNHSIALIASLIMFIPVYLVVVNSLKTKAEASAMGAGLPTSLNWENFAIVIERGKLLTAFGNSVLYAVGATLIGTTLAALAAYVLSRNRTRFNRYVYFFIIMGIAMPTNFVTLMKVMQLTHLINTQVGIILLYAASSIPFSVFLIYAFIGTLPRELDEAAIIDGCSPIRLFFSVIYPLLTPVSGHCGRAKSAGHLERVLAAAVLSQQQRLLADDAGRLQLLWPVPGRLEPGFG